MGFTRNGFAADLRCWATAALALGVLAACGQQKSGAWQPLKITAEQADADLEALRTASFTMKANGPADIASVVAAMPDPVSITWDALTFDAASGATVLQGVKLGIDDAPGIGVAISKLSLWDLDTDFATARLKGERLNETAAIARRVEASGVSLFGLETMFGPAMNAYTDAIEDVVVDQIDSAVSDPAVADAMREEFAAAGDMTFEKYNFSIGRIVLDDLVLRPYVLTPLKLDPSSEFAEIMPFAQSYAAIWRSLGVDSFAYFDMDAEVAMTQLGQTMNASAEMDSYIVRGMRGGDTDVALMKGLTYDLDMIVPTRPSAISAIDPEADDPTSGFEMTPMAVSASVARYSAEGMRLDKLLDHLARGVMPPRTTADLMSVGVFRADDMQIGINGANVYTIGAFIMEAKDFHWFIPTRLRLAASDVVYNIDGFFSLIQTMDSSPLADAASLEEARKYLAVAAKYGLDKPSFDTDYTLAWNPKTGASSLKATGGLDGYMHGGVSIDGVLPTFDAVSALIPAEADDTDSEAMSKLFADASAFKGFEVNLIDEGGLTKGFALAADIIAMAPPGDQTVAMFRNAGPDGLRQVAVNGIMLGASQAAMQVPQLEPLLTAFADFVAKGGSLKYRSAPAKPVDAEAFEAATSDPAVMFKLLNLSVTHTPAKPAK